ncbi:subclass B1 metallo-beta-lactamase [Flagellimonas nanhaiensis]|uniref:beta-lactamase n=1 Tax=Flagellimonas nanhaiensis TaxID=2292706 RepID=A0A371JPC9_9FLAO|nr:subclass B1 metallo-beta-lactamase [Allomuricauda nanhaiensis]RDY59372.1 subclass B1 metallo-beta-lactamase [Allomuricauda nanhaiensis]
MKNTIRLAICLFALLGCKQIPEKKINYESETLKIQQLSPQTFLHISYLKTETWGKVGCNGAIFISDGEAIVFDTPINDVVSADLINWVEKELQCAIKAVVVTHFHDDCLGGLNAFHEREITSYANSRTLKLVPEHLTLPQNGFSSSMKIPIGSEVITLDFLGEGHTLDNIVGYFPKDGVLFGGCLLKSMGAGKGNLEDANTSEWSNTVSKVKSKYSEATIIVPGHGKVGGRELLDFTIDLFKTP